MPQEPAEPDVVRRMRTAQAHARTALGVLPDHGVAEAWGWRGRTLSRPVTAPDGPAWLRLVSAPKGQLVRTFWDGCIEAEKRIPRTVPRPRLRRWHDWRDEQSEYRAELYDRVAARPAARSAVLTAEPELSAWWWEGLRAVLDDVAAVATRRVTVYQ